MSHQRRVWFLLTSTKSQPQLSPSRSLCQQSLRFGLVQQTGLLRPGNKVRIRIQVFAGGRAAFPADGVAEVQTEFSPDQLELFGRRSLIHGTRLYHKGM